MFSSSSARKSSRSSKRFFIASTAAGVTHMIYDKYSTNWRRNYYCYPANANDKSERSPSAHTVYRDKPRTRTNDCEIRFLRQITCPGPQRYRHRIVSNETGDCAPVNYTVYLLFAYISSVRRCETSRKVFQ